jgi:hypothetical protein
MSGLGKDHLNVVLLGNSGAGKSTTVGHLLHKLGDVDRRMMERFDREAREAPKANMKYALVRARAACGQRSRAPGRRRRAGRGARAWAWAWAWAGPRQAAVNRLGPDGGAAAWRLGPQTPAAAARAAVRRPARRLACSGGRPGHPATAARPRPPAPPRARAAGG